MHALLNNRYKQLLNESVGLELQQYIHRGVRCGERTWQIQILPSSQLADQTHQSANPLCFRVGIILQENYKISDTIAKNSDTRIRLFGIDNSLICVYI
jgi:hypothetical protein